jgi:hypothetical protein
LVERQRLSISQIETKPAILIPSQGYSVGGRDCVLHMAAVMLRRGCFVLLSKELNGPWNDLPVIISLQQTGGP